MTEEKFVAIVQKVFLDGAHGPYAKSKHPQLGTITFSLDEGVWKETSFPGEGDMVVLTDVRKKRAGWRAGSGRFYRPSDERKQ